MFHLVNYITSRFARLVLYLVWEIVDIIEWIVVALDFWIVWFIIGNIF